MKAPAATPAPAFDLARVQELTGTYTDAQIASRVLAKCAEIGHLVSPVTVVHALPPGVGVGISSVLLDPQRDAYTPPGTSLLAPTKRGIDLIAGAAGVAWDSRASGIVHQERDRIIFTCAGSATLLDGRDRPLVGTKDMDVRDGSPAVFAMIESSIRKHAKEHGQNCSRECADRSGHEAAQNQIRELRKHLLSHAETKAGLRAVRRGFALRAAYRPEELLKPFLVVQAVWTGRSEDPALARMFAERTADRFLGARDRMYGPQQVRQAEVIDVRTTEERAADAAGEDEDAPPRQAPNVQTGTNGTSGERGSNEKGASAPVQPPASQPAAQHDAPEGPEASQRLRLPKKGGGGALLAEASDKDLAWWQNTISGNIEAGRGDPRYREKDEQLLGAIEAEMEWRGANDPAVTMPPEDLPW